ARLFGSFESGCEGKWVLEDRYQAEILRNRFERHPRARRGAAGKLPADVANPPLDARRGRSEHAPRFLLNEDRTELEWDGIEAAGEHDARAARLGCRLMPVDHLL